MTRRVQRTDTTPSLSLVRDLPAGTPIHRVSAVEVHLLRLDTKQRIQLPAAVRDALPEDVEARDLQVHVGSGDVLWVSGLFPDPDREEPCASGCGHRPAASPGQRLLSTMRPHPESARIDGHLRLRVTEGHLSCLADARAAGVLAVVVFSGTGLCALTGPIAATVGGALSDIRIPDPDKETQT